MNGGSLNRQGMDKDTQRHIDALKPLFKLLAAKKRAERQPDDPIAVRLPNGKKGFVNPKTQPRLAEAILPGDKIYLFQAENTQYFKIGFTKGNVFRRMQSIEQSNPFTLGLLACRAGTKREEKELLRKLAGFRTRGEWFHLSDNDVFKLLAEDFRTISCAQATYYSSNNLTLEQAGELRHAA